MINKKKSVLIFLIALLFVLPSISAIYITVASKPIVNTIMNNQDKPLIYEFIITNNGVSSNFEIYTYEKFKVEPNEFNLSDGETKTIQIEFYPIGSMKDNLGYITIPYYIKDKLNPNREVYNDKIIVKLINFKEAFKIISENVNLNSNSFKIDFYNVEDATYEDMDVIFSSVFINDNKQTITLKPYQKQEVTIPIANDKIKKFVAGTYTLSATITLNEKTEVVQTPVKILEKSSLSVNEFGKGIIVRRNTVEKLNEGNVPTVAEITITKDIISRFFTTFSLEPSRIDRKGFLVYYTWQKELSPDEKLSVSSTTNWTFPLIIIILVIAIMLIFNAYLKQDLVIKKNVGFVKTKSNEFALKITIRIKARKFVEKITLYDRLPGMTKLYEKFGECGAPSKVDVEKGRLQWEIPRMVEGEERIFSYIIYSKLNVVGKFELPSANAIYELLGKLHDAKSNRAFFINEPRHQSNQEI